ncbi:MAG TPA: choice-of-anchor L domain-containing protein, partial [Chitinophagales bacterium]|nr:choice-of-anchor L domain-containing protein [Chitinophagales bacterium]
YTGAAPAVGYFSNGSGIGMESGLILTTGNTDVAPGPNSTEDAGYAPGTPGDATLEAVTGVFPTYDASSLEFDFVSFNDTVTFRYIFASEEYNEFVCSEYNDVFAFLVSGTGYAPNTNIALIPGTAIPVAINSVNNGTPGDFLGIPYDPANCTSLSNIAYYIDNNGGQVTQFDGYTVPLTATMVVVPCDTYHIKLVIADVGDELYDSGVFLQAQSFTAGQSVGIRAVTGSGTRDAFEGCSDGTFTFFREDSTNITDAITIAFTLSGTAVEGMDFQNVPHSITIPANEYSASFSLNTILDGMVEGQESVIVSYQDVCSCNLFKRDTLFIFDNVPLSAAITGPDTICLNQQATLNATGSGSMLVPYQYLWNTGADVQSITVNPAVTTTYTVTVTDFCAGQTAIASFQLNVAPEVNAAFTTVTPQCLLQNSFDFNNTSTYTGIASFAWNLGDGTIASSRHVANHSYAAAGNYNVALTVTVNGCSDSVTQTITVMNSPVTNRTAAICPDSSFFAGGAFQNTPGLYYDTFTAASGCDSVVVTDLMVLPYLAMNRLVVICNGDSFFAGGAWQYTQGIYYDTVPQAVGCDMIVITEMTVFGNSFITRYVSICTGDSLHAGGAFQNTSGVYYDTFAAANGCDSVVTTNLTVLDTSVTHISASICDGDSLFAGGAWQYSAGVYYDVLTNGNGCDSTVITALDVLGNSVTSVNRSICKGDSLHAGGAFQNTSGVYYDTFAAANGCDSVVTTVLAVLDTSLTIIHAFICEGDSLFAGGAWQTSAGTYFDYLTNSDGCDSTVMTLISVDSIIRVQNDVMICSGENYFAGGAWQTSAGIYVDSFIAAGGCDSIVTTILTVADTFQVSVTVTICEGDSVYAGGAWQTASGIYVDSLLGRSGCDSTVATALTVINTIRVAVDAAICEGQSYMAGGALQTASGIYTDVYPAASGCDSIVTTTLTVSDTFVSNISAAICQGDSFFAGGAWQSVPGVYYDSFFSAAGCDSTVITTLSVANTLITPLDVSVCFGESYFAGGAWQTTAGVYIDSFIAAGGCDSIVTTRLTVLDTFVTTVSAAICEGDSVYAGGAWQKATGVYIDTLNSSGGCDSTVVTNLSIIPILTYQLDTFICAGENYFAGGAWQNSTGTYTDTFGASTGCDSILTTRLTVIEISVSGDTTTVCFGQETTLTAPIGYASYLWIPGGETSNAKDAGAGAYEVMLTDTNGCSASAFYVVNENDSIGLRAVPPADTIIEGETTRIQLFHASSASISYDWTPSAGLNCTHCDRVAASPEDDIIYTAIATDDNGCSDTVTIPITVDTLLEPLVYIPNAFTPNGDTENDVFLIYGQGFESFHLLIFDRWGQKLFESFDPATGWDGTYRGKLCNPGVYVYYLDAKFVRGVKPPDLEKYRKGSVTLIR